MRRKVVVTGIGSINALGNSLAESWKKAAAGIGGIDTITKFDASKFKSQMAAEVKGFDPSAVIPHKELKKMGLFIQYSLCATKEALDHANLEINEEIAESVGVLVGVGIGDLEYIYKTSVLIKDGKQNRISPFFIPATLPNMASGQISIFFGAKNYNTSVVSACSSSNHSIGDSAKIIERGDAQVMICGGSESTICSLAIGGFSAMRALSFRNDSPKTASRPYDIGRDGFVLGEGCGILILEEEEFAKSRGAKIYAEMLGYGYSADSHHMTAPSLEGPAQSMRMALKDAQLNTSEIDYINAHGTSTPLGDENEIKAIKVVFGEDAKRLSISATKSMHGHALGGAGGIEAAISLKAMQEGIVPPTINIENLDPECDLDVTPNKAKERTINALMSNSFGFGGTNATLIFKKYN